MLYLLLYVCEKIKGTLRELLTWKCKPQNRWNKFYISSPTQNVFCELAQNQNGREGHLRIYLEFGSWRENWIASELCTVISYWSGCICAPVDGMLGALLPAQPRHHWERCLTSPRGRLYWKPSHFASAMVYIGVPFNPFFLTLAHLNGPPVKPFSENMQPGFLGGPGLSWEFSLMDCRLSLLRYMNSVTKEKWDKDVPHWNM